MVKFRVDYFAGDAYVRTERFSCSFFIDAVHLANALSAVGDTYCCIYKLDSKDGEIVPYLMAEIYIEPRQFPNMLY